MKEASLQITRVTGADLERHIPALAGLRIQVFRDFPYLYAGDADYESKYLRTEFSWREIDELSESVKPMVFWLKPA